VRSAVIPAVIILLAAPVSGDVPFTGSSALYFERGHYWIELHVAAGDSSVSIEPPARSAFSITEVGTGAASFSPSRVELVTDESGARFVILSSGRLKGRRCYSVVYDPGGEDEIVFETACDPAAVEPSPPGNQGARFFRKHIAPAFTVSGEEYRFNKLALGYDFTSEKVSSEIMIEPIFEIGPVSINPFFSYDATTYDSGSESERSVERSKYGFSLGTALWAGGVRWSLESGYSDDRNESTGPAGESVERAGSARAALWIRLDNLFDRANRHGISVLKGIDLGFGYFWYDSVSGGGDLEMTAPLAAARLTWTVLAGLQLSWSTEACFPEGSEGSTEFYNRFRARLLLREALTGPEGRSYHPDLELAVETGRRPPFFGEERRITLGFTFDLYPW
jgi:hypothetical protein